MQDQPSASKTTPSLTKRIAATALRTFVVFYLLILVSLVLMETRLVYPGAYMKSGMIKALEDASNVKTVRYHASDGTSLNGRLLQCDNAENFVLYFHGNGTKAVWLDAKIERISRRLNATVMAAEYRGYCDDDNTTPYEAGLVDDSLSARDYFCQKYSIQPSDVVLYGSSLGGGCAVAVAEDSGAKTLILERTFDSLVAVSAKIYWFVPVRLLMRNRFNSLERIQAFHGPLIQVHGTTDQLVPIENGRKLFDSAPSASKQWVEVTGMGHNDRLPEDALNQITTAVYSVLDSSG